MKTVARLGATAVVALVAMAFVGAASAAAFTKWTVDGVEASGQQVSLADDGNGLTLSHTGGTFGNVTIVCTGSGTGHVFSGGADDVTSVTATGCTTTQGFCGSPNATAVNLSWATQLSGNRDNISDGGSGLPGWQVQCFGFVQVTCTANTSVGVSNGSSDVNLAFDSSSGSASCSDGGTGTVRGNVIASIPGHSLQAQ